MIIKQSRLSPFRIVVMHVLACVLSTTATAEEAAPVSSPPALPVQQLMPLTSPEAAWSGSYLVNYAFLSEYALLWKDDAPIDPEFMLQEKGQALWKRAFFAAEAMRVRAQMFPDDKTLNERLQSHFAGLKKSNPGIEGEKSLLAIAATLPQSPEEQAKADSGFELVVGSFSTAAQQSQLRQLRYLYFADAPSCPISTVEVKEFALHQLKLLEAKSAINGGQLITPLKEWSLKKVRCLVFALLATSEEAKRTGGTDPLHLMLTFQQMASPLAKDMSYKSVYAIRLLQTNQFAETLRILIELVDLQPAFRLPYEMVQRIFSVRQKGDGQVALKGI